jgi:3-dehydroquinate synthase
MKAGAGHNVQVQAHAGSAASYDVVIRPGALDELATLVPRVAPAARYAVLTPDRIAPLYGHRVLAALGDAGLRAELFQFPDGEHHKTRDSWGALTDALLAAGYGRDSCVIALGGGVAGDLAGFVAATYMRGIPVVQVPTTLLAMIDASVGGKTGVDTPAGKNLIGAFHPPRLVLMDPRLLATLPPEQFRSGLAEAVKHGAILDEAYFQWILEDAGAILAGDEGAVTRLVARSVELKAAVVAEDPLEHGLRAILNFGHTVGHALELDSGYSMLHGYAVALGMLAEAAAGERAGVTQSGTVARLQQALLACGIPVTAHGVDVAAVAMAMRLDKKAREGTPRLALLRHIGRCAPAADGRWTHGLPEDVIAGSLQGLAQPPRAV